MDEVRCLPPELRNQVYEYVLIGTEPLKVSDEARTAVQPPLTMVSRSIRMESLPIFYAHNKFMALVVQGDTVRAYDWLYSIGTKNAGNLRSLEIDSMMSYTSRVDEDWDVEFNNDRSLADALIKNGVCRDAIQWTQRIGFETYFLSPNVSLPPSEPKKAGENWLKFVGYPPKEGDDLDLWGSDAVPPCRICKRHASSKGTTNNHVLNSRQSFEAQPRPSRHVYEPKNRSHVKEHEVSQRPFYFRHADVDRLTVSYIASIRIYIGRESPFAKALQLAIQPKLIECGWVVSFCDTVLSEWIVAKLADGSSAGHVAAAVAGGLLVGSSGARIEAFLRWLLKEIIKLDTQASLPTAKQDPHYQCGLTTDSWPQAALVANTPWLKLADYDRRRGEKLAELCEERGLAVLGFQDDLVERLQLDDARRLSCMLPNAQNKGAVAEDEDVEMVDAW